MMIITGGLTRTEIHQQVGSPTGEIYEVYQADNQPHWWGEDQDAGLEYSSAIGQMTWGLGDQAVGNEPVLNIVTITEGTDPADPVTPLTNTQPTVVVWGDLGAVASYTFIQGGTGVASGTTRYSQRANSLGVDVDMNVVSPVIDIGADVLAGGTFIDISYDTIETTTSDLYLMNVFSAVNLLTLGADLYGINLDFSTTRVTPADNMDIFGYRVALPALAQTTAVTTNYRGYQIPTAGAISDSSTTAFNWYATDFVLPQTTVTGTATATVIGYRIASSGNLSTTTAAGTINWRGMDLSSSVGTVISNFAGSAIDWRGINMQLPAETQTAGTSTVTGIQVTGGTVTSGTMTGLNVTMEATYGGTQIAGVFQGDGRLTHINTTSQNFLSRPTTVDTGVDVAIDSLASPIIDIGADVFSTGTFIDIAYDTAETLTGALTGMRINLNTSVTVNSGGSLRVIDIDLPAHTQSAAATTTLAGYRIGSAGAIATDTAAGTINYTVIDLDTGVTAITANFAGSAINWRGIDLRSPSITETAGTATVIGLDLDMDAVITTGGTLTGINLILQNTYTTANEIGIIVQGDGRLTHINTTAQNFLSRPTTVDTGVDVAIDSLASPVIDIGADVFATGTFIDISYDTIETTTGALDIINIFSAVNLLTLGGDLTGIRFNFAETRVTPATDQDITIIEALFPAFTQSAANTTTYRGVEMITAGALVQDTAAGTINFYGLDLATPAMQVNFAAGVLNTAVIRSNTAGLINTDTSGTVTWYGFDLTTAEVDADSTGTTTVAGFNIGTAGALNQATGAGTINWYGSRIQMPVVTETTGTVTAYGHSVILADIVSATATSPEVAGYHFTTPADTHSLAVEVTYRGLYGSAAGALIQDTAAGEIRWHGLDLVAPASTISFAASTIETAMFRVGTAGALASSTSGTHNWYGIDLVAPASTSTGTATTTVAGLRIGTAGALEINTGVATTNWRGVELQLPNTTETTGIININALRILAGTVTTAISSYKVLHSTMPAFTVSTVNSGTFIWLHLASSGNLVTNTAAGSITWNGIDMSSSVGTILTNFAGSTIDWRGITIVTPAITQTAGTATADALRIQTGAYTSGTHRFWRFENSASAVMSEFIMNDGTIVHPTLRVYDNGGTDFIQFYDDDTTSWIVSNPNGIAIAPSNDVDDYILFSTIANVPGFASQGAADLDIQNVAAAAIYDVTFFANQLVPAATPAAGSTPELRIYGWSSATINTQVFSTIRTSALNEAVAETGDEVAVMRIHPANNMLVLSESDNIEFTAGVTDPTLRIYGANGTVFTEIVGDGQRFAISDATNTLFALTDNGLIDMNPRTLGAGQVLIDIDHNGGALLGSFDVMNLNFTNATTTVATANLTGINLNFTNVTMTPQSDFLGVQIIPMATHTNSTNATTDTITIFTNSTTASAITTNIWSDAQIDWFGFRLQGPSITASGGPVNLTGVYLDINQAINGNPAGTITLYGTNVELPALTTNNATALTHTITGYRIDSAGALVTNHANADIDWTGLFIISPAVTQTLGSTTVYGIDLDMNAAVTTGGTVRGINLVMQATYTTANEIAINITGDGRTIEIGNTENAIDILGGQTATGLIDLNPNGTAAGTVIDITATAVVLVGDPVGINVDLSATTMDNINSTGFAFDINPAVTHTTAAGTFTHQNTITGGAITVSPASGSVTANWYGTSITMPAVTLTTVATETAIINAYGLLITGGVATLSGGGGTETLTYQGIRVDMTAEASDPVTGIYVDVGAGTGSIGIDFGGMAVGELIFGLPADTGGVGTTYGRVAVNIQGVGTRYIELLNAP